MSSETPEVAEQTETEESVEEAAEQTPKRGKIKFESRLLAEEAVAYFESIVEGLRKRQLTLSHKDTVLSLEPGAWVNVKVKASAKDGRQKVEFGIEWNPEEEGTLEITTEAPDEDCA